MKFKAILFVVMFACLVACCSDAHARWRPFRRSSGNTSYSSVSFTGGPQSVASQKAARAAANGRWGHQGGSFGGARYEGVGFGSTAQAALNNCCFTGQKTVAGSAVVQGRNGWYAVKLYW